MKTYVISSLIANILIVAFTELSALQIQNDANQAQRENYHPIATDFLVRYLDDHKPAQKITETNEQSIVKRNLDQIGGGNLVRNIASNDFNEYNDERSLRNLDQIGGGNLVRDLSGYKIGAKRNLDQIGGGNLVRSLYESSRKQKMRKNRMNGPNSIRLGNLENLFKSRNEADDRTMRNLDQIGGGNLVRSSNTFGAGLLRNLDQIGGGNLVRNLDQIGGGNLVRNLDQIGGGNLVRNLDQIGGGNLVRDVDRFYDCVTDEHNRDNVGGSHLLRSTRHNADFYPGLVYEKQRYFPLRRPSILNSRIADHEEIYPLVFDRLGKRNIDEIDANVFDNFYKRNFDEIDRVGWSGFVKRLSDYLIKQQQQRQQQEQP
uniref:uncharacterized protein LOC127068197 n=1 Tax=Vespula vulgaris TaxID=7454 RepID=UPI00223BA889|nr:uncharacterized protein LOC127068197 [Vespula vulgaris]